MSIRPIDAAELDRIEGWLSARATIFTQHLIQYQRENGWITGVLELGVYRGKYLALLAQQVVGTGVPVVGVDAFLERFGVKLEEPWRLQAENQIRDAVARVAGSMDTLTLVDAYSRDVTVDHLRAICPAYSFISVDAGHDADDVEQDAALAGAVLSDDGVIAFDDVYNAVCPGVAEGFMRYMMRPDANLAPFATSGNKVFVCRPDVHRAYCDFSKALARTIGAASPAFARTSGLLETHEANDWSPRVLGYEVVTFI